MKKFDELPVHSLIGGMTTDYFEFWCEECGQPVIHLEFAGEDTVGVRLKARCEKCKRDYEFKIRVMPALGPLSPAR